MRRWACLLLVLAVLTAQSGGLQVVAWLNMALRDGSVAAAVTGKACTMCAAAKALDAGQDDRTAAVKVVKKVDLAVAPLVCVLMPAPVVVRRLPMVDGGGMAQWSVVPDVPPPQRG